MRKAGGNALMWCFDVYEEREHIVVEGDLPGFEQDDLAVFGDESRIVLSGTRRHRVRGPERRYFHLERRHATVHREIALPQPVEADRAQVTLRHGVLRVRIPLARGAREPHRESA